MRSFSLPLALALACSLLAHCAPTQTIPDATAAATGTSTQKMAPSATPPGTMQDSYDTVMLVGLNNSESSLVYSRGSCLNGAFLCVSGTFNPVPHLIPRPTRQRTRRCGPFVIASTTVSYIDEANNGTLTPLMHYAYYTKTSIYIRHFSSNSPNTNSQSQLPYAPVVVRKYKSKTKALLGEGNKCTVPPLPTAPTPESQLHSHSSTLDMIHAMEMESGRVTDEELLELMEGDEGGAATTQSCKMPPIIVAASHAADDDIDEDEFDMEEVKAARASKEHVLGIVRQLFSSHSEVSQNAQVAPPCFPELHESCVATRLKQHICNYNFVP